MLLAESLFGWYLGLSVAFAVIVVVVAVVASIMTLAQRIAEQAPLATAGLNAVAENTSLIPAEWKGKAVFFWGTLYRRGDGAVVIRCLCWNGNRWDWGYYPMDHQLDFSNRAAVLVDSE